MSPSRLKNITLSDSLNIDGKSIYILTYVETMDLFGTGRLRATAVWNDRT
jgi:hypothetical protein